jgi:hypothetical protein
MKSDRNLMHSEHTVRMHAEHRYVMAQQIDISIFLSVFDSFS